MKPFYVIREHSRTTQTLAGAFDTEEEANKLKLSLQKLGIVAIVVRRTDSTTENRE